MSYVIKAVLSNPQCPGYGLVTVPFPIPDHEYDRTIELLSGLKIGDALEQDCRVDELDSWYGVLNVLNGTSVNVDELDYLAKRLDSFCEDEGAQFQAMAHKLGLSNIQDLINLTFCCQQATVITDFSDLEAVGRSHYMNLHGGSALTEELENLDGVETALLLIDGGGEAVTPYGVVYDNGMKLERLYDGRHFPAYFYDVHPLALEITQDPNGSREYLYFPTSSKKIDRTLLRAGADLRFAPACHDLPEQTAFAMDLDHLEMEDLPALNRICQLIKAMPPLELKKLDAAVMMTMPHGADEMCRLAENLEQFDFVPGVKTPEEYGRYMIRESGHFEYDENLEGFYDFLGYGLQQTEKEQGQFNTLGYISYHGDLTLDELLREAPAEQCQRELGPQMGGLS